MSRRGLQKRLLLDTSFLLPILGFETTRRIMDTIPLLSGHELYYSELSILEALWKIAKRIAQLPPHERKRAAERVAEGVDAITSHMASAQLTSSAVSTALEMYWSGHRDLIDNLLYGIAEANNLLLLTVDDHLVEFVRARGGTSIITPEELKETRGDREPQRG